MSASESPEIEPTTAWHPMLVALLEIYLPDGWQLFPEFLLGRLPQRVDIVVVRRIHEPLEAARKIHSILHHLRPHTLIEHKGPTDDLEPGDALTLLGYAAQYMRMNKLADPAELCLMVVCDRIPRGFVEQIRRLGGKLSSTGGGLWGGELAGMIMHGVETREAYRASPTERLLYAFSRAFLTAPAGVPLDAEERQVYHSLYQQVEQFRRERGDMAIRDFEALQKSDEEFTAMWLARVKPEKRLQGLSSEEIAEAIHALPPEVQEELKKKLS
jgi:hypothetical protein